ncbi:MAG: type II toxin-antitoxin system RelE/ParE family toxin [Deltaproteobacteria bacterium]|nr:type II toxin-antitoxin system RelE/ParE family toxin [Deltaproteobacteria bacterium]
MKVSYRKSFVKDLKKIKNLPDYDRIFDVAFTAIVNADSIREVTEVKSMKGYPNRYRIRIGNYRMGVEIHNNNIEVMRVLHRREFYRYFP